jgi:CRP-like cAMP-binding protein/AmiR/NasT family two-component response regulator
MKKILLIEDNDNIRNNTAEILELSNYKVIMAENGKEGVEKAIMENPDLIVCDIMMPVLDGYGVLHALQKSENLKNTPFIFLTAKTEKDDFRKGMDLGADDYITKPFTGTDILKAIDSRLRKLEVLKANLLGNIEGFQTLVELNQNKNPLHSLVENPTINRYKKKQLVYSEGNHPHRLYYVLKGKVKAFKTNEEGKELVIELFTEGDYLGYIALLEGSPYKDSAETLEETELAIISKEDFENLINRNRQVAQKFIKMLARNISEKEEQLLGMAYNSLRKKVAEALILLLRKFPNQPDNTRVMDLSRDSLASIAGTATESVIRTLSDFKQEKILDIHNGNIKILNLKKLEDLAN